MKVNEIPFHQLLARPLLVRYNASRLFEGHDVLSWPDGADAILGYAYYDRQAGLNLAILAPANFEEGVVYHDAAPLATAKARMMLRPGTYDECDAATFSEDDEEQLVELYAEDCRISDSYWADDPDVVEMLRIAEIDHLRHPQYPLDVQVYYLIESGGIEAVWIRLEGFSEEGHLTGELLNQPYGECVAVTGDLMALGATKDGENVLRLFTRDEMILEPRGRMRYEEFTRRRAEERK